MDVASDGTVIITHRTPPVHEDTAGPEGGAEGGADVTHQGVMEFDMQTWRVSGRVRVVQCGSSSPSASASASVSASELLSVVQTAREPR